MQTDNPTPRTRRSYPDELKREAVQMLLDSHSAATVAANLGLSSTNLLYRWRAQFLAEQEVPTTSLEARIRQLEEQLRQTERERDVLKKALAIFSRSG